MEKNEEIKNRRVRVLLIISLLVVIFYIGYRAFLVPLSEKLVQKDIELRMAKEKLSEIESKLLTEAEVLHKQQKYSDSLFHDWEKRQSKTYKNTQYEKDINYISNATLLERTKLLSEWLSSTRTSRNSTSTGQ